MTTQIPAPDRDELVHLRNSGMTREQIAIYYGVALSRVKRWIRELDIPSVPAASVEKEKQKPTEGVDLGPDYGLTLIERAKNALGARMSQDYRGYLLDGRPVRVDILIRAAGLSVPDVP